MGYSLTIGKAGVEVDNKYGSGIYPAVIPCEDDGKPELIWVDDMGSDGACRCPSYSGWHECLAVLPIFKALWDFLEKKVKEEINENYHDGYKYFIPCSIYSESLDSIEKEALSKKNTSHWDAAKRAMWFVKWSREAIKRYGEFAAFETPAEWI